MFAVQLCKSLFAFRNTNACTWLAVKQVHGCLQVLFPASENMRHRVADAAGNARDLRARIGSDRNLVLLS